MQRNIGKMKQLKFNELKILKALLDKTKTTFIVKAWKEVKAKNVNTANPKLDNSPYIIIKKSVVEVDKASLLGDTYKRNTYAITTLEKPCKYKEGEICEVVWDKDGRYKWFCRNCGNVHLNKQSKVLPFPCKSCGMIAGNFNKILGKVKITKIEKIEIFKGFKSGKLRIQTKPFPGDLIDAVVRDDVNFTWEELSKSEGFKNPEEMFSYLEEYAGDLSKPKPFWLISYEWVE